jgi:hypothetical protein
MGSCRGEEKPARWSAPEEIVVFQESDRLLEYVSRWRHCRVRIVIDLDLVRPPLTIRWIFDIRTKQDGFEGIGRRIFEPPAVSATRSDRRNLHALPHYSRTRLSAGVL